MREGIRPPAMQVHDPNASKDHPTSVTTKPRASHSPTVSPIMWWFFLKCARFLSSKSDIAIHIPATVHSTQDQFRTRWMFFQCGVASLPYRAVRIAAGSSTPHAMAMRIPCTAGLRREVC